MPVYEFYCHDCGDIFEVSRPIESRNRAFRCHHCKKPIDRIVSVPTMHVWNTDFRFPNVVHTGDGSANFPSRAAYEAHLKEAGLGEDSTAGKIERPHGNRVIRKVR